MAYEPIFLAGVFRACGNVPPLNVASPSAPVSLSGARIGEVSDPSCSRQDKDRWIDAERVRWARLFGVPMADAPLPGFPVRTLAVRAPSALLPLAGLPPPPR